MILENIEVINFKNFSNLNVSFNKGVNLLVGINGSGKTSLLEAINVALGGFFGSQEFKMQRMIDFSEIRMTNTKLATEAKISSTSSLIGRWSRKISRDTKNNDTAPSRMASNYGLTFFRAFENENDRTIAPVIVYYSTQRLFKDANSSAKQRYNAAIGRKNGYLQCLKENAIKGVLNEWLGNAVTRKALMQIEGIEKTDLTLKNVEGAIKKSLIYFLELPTDFPLKIYRDPDFDNELFISIDDNNSLPINYYSDGFRNLLYLVIDIVWRASQLNPWLTLDEITEQINGVVTIDEIDLHLHPKWQAKAINLIQELFPNVQFFITTHSPTVVANFKDGTLYKIDNNEVIIVNDKYYGKEVNEVLVNLMGANYRNKEVLNEFNTLFDLIEKKDTIKYLPLLNSLITIFGQDDIEIIKAKALIEFYKK